MEDLTSRAIVFKCRLEANLNRLIKKDAKMPEDKQAAVPDHLTDARKLLSVVVVS